MAAIQAAVTGTVWQVLVKPGQAVAEGETLLVVESMKMEIPVSAEHAGVVREVLVAEGEGVEDYQDVVVLDPLP